MQFDPKDLQKAMKKMGMEQEPIDAEEVVIKGRDQDIVIKRPQVQKISMQGQETFQVTGDVQERGSDDSGSGPSITDEDVEMVQKETGADEEEAREALESTDGNIAEAIMELQ